MKKILYTHTPFDIPCPVIHNDVIDAENTGQVYPPGGGALVTFTYCTLTPLPTEV